ncbi:Hypothetical protein NG00_01970 [Corynebacterium camporealensis]|uniref:Uncharacterized protein n=1 Tax=Corynebacterium camporealensis TaxID=161896 RepID=A0A0F6TCK6_9CORY|nr:DUF1707 domain-containing protein [Corynebacterium camporealensis]AKE40136.1 protein of unknown function (DUF1707) [Corynebacterium camporealensis]AVH89208.1 Hypothetical protein NG00_01970 [Corynebacterium camporealensis]
MSSQHPSRPEIRLSDQERGTAMDALGRAFAEGRLTMDEYDERCRQVTAATKRSELAQLFDDLPADLQHSPADGPLYSAAEIAEAHRAGKKTRLGVMSLTTVGTFVATPLLILVHPGFSALIAIIPTVFILLYIMKIGPASWFAPSPRALEKQRLREIRAAYALENAERQAHNEARREELRAQRSQLAGELTNEAMGFVKRSIDRMRK